MARFVASIAGALLQGNLCDTKHAVDVPWIDELRTCHPAVLNGCDDFRIPEFRRLELSSGAHTALLVIYEAKPNAVVGAV